MFKQFQKTESKMFKQFQKTEPKKSDKSDKVDYQIENVMQLRQSVDEIRDGWFGQENKRKGEGYTPSEHDKIKFNINLYLGQMAQFFLPFKISS